MGRRLRQRRKVWNSTEYSDGEGQHGKGIAKERSSRVSGLS